MIGGYSKQASAGFAALCLFIGLNASLFAQESVRAREGGSVVHYVRDPRTGELMDFKFKKMSGGSLGRYEKSTEGGFNDFYRM